MLQEKIKIGYINPNDTVFIPNLLSEDDQTNFSATYYRNPEMLIGNLIIGACDIALIPQEICVEYSEDMQILKEAKIYGELREGLRALRRKKFPFINNE